MQENGERPQLAYRHGRPPRPGAGLLARVLAFAAGAVVLAAAVAISIVVFALALTGVVLFGLYLWWKTRKTTNRMRARRYGDVIEGEVIRKDERPDH